MQDVYKLSLLGALKQGFNSETALETLSNLFKVSPEIIERYLDGKKRVVKQGLTLDEAKQYQAIFNRAGAFSEIDLVLDRRILEESSIVIEDGCLSAEQPPDSEASISDNTFAAEPEAVVKDQKRTQARVSNFLQSPGIEFDVYRFVPPIFSGPGAVPTTDPGGAKIGTIESTKPTLGSALTITATIIAAFVIHRLGLNFLLAKFSTAFFVTPLVIFIFLMSLIFLPRVFRIGKVLSVSTSEGGKPKHICLFRERKWGWPFTREFLVVDDSDKPIARVKKNQFFLTYACTTEAGAVIYQADPDMDIEESVAYLGESVREELFTAAALIVQGFGKIKSIANFFKKKGQGSNKKVIDIFDEHGAVTAKLKISKSRLKKPRVFTLLVKDGASSAADRRILLAFALLIAGL